MTRRKNGKATLEDTRHLLADVNNQIADVRRKRADELHGSAAWASLARTLPGKIMPLVDQMVEAAELAIKNLCGRANLPLTFRQAQ